MPSSNSYEGYGSGYYSRGGYGQMMLEMLPDSVSMTASLGTPSLQTNNNISVTGLGLTTSLGNESVVINVDVNPTSLLLTVSLAEEFVWGEIVPPNVESWSAVSPSNSSTWTPLKET